MAQPIIPWVGGKRRLADQLIPRFPPHSCYVELFAGGAALYFLRPPADVEVINDINGELTNLYRVVKHHLEEFMRQFKWALSSREVFRWLQDTPAETLTDVQRAARFFYLQQHAFGGKVQSQSWGTATTAPPVNLLRLEETLSAAHLRLTNAYIENLPWLACLERYTAAISACSSTPTFVPTPAPAIPPLPPAARQPATPSLCSPSCLDGLMRERQSWRASLTSAEPQALPASAPTTR